MTTPLPWALSDGGRADAGYVDPSDRDCVTRAIAIGTGRPYREIHDMVDAAGHERGITDAAERGVLLELTAQLLVGDLGWEPIDVYRARLTREDLEKPLSEHRVLIAEVEFSEMRGTELVVISHLTAVLDGVVQDTDGMRDQGTNSARICDRVVQLYARPDGETFQT